MFAVIGTVYGEGDGSTTFALPDLRERYIEGQNTTPVGTYLKAGLPNLNGVLSNVRVGSGLTALTGVFQSSALLSNAEGGGGTHQWSRVQIGFNAHDSNSIYGASTTVQPPAVIMRFYIKY